MKKILLVSKALLLLCTLFSSLVSMAQSDVSALIKSSPADATKLTQAYLDPFFKGLGVGLNSGWNNTAHSKNLGRFELRFGVTGAIIPSSGKTFDVTKIGLSNNLQPTNSTLVIAPTVAGSKNIGPSMDIKDENGATIDRFTLPQGQNLPFVPAPQLQGTVGLIKGIDVTLRAMPTLNIGEDFGSIGMFGGGVKVEIIPLIAGKTAKMVLPFDIAVAAGYTQFNYKLELDVQAPSGSTTDGQPSKNIENQMIDAKFSGVNLEAIISKKLMFFTPFLSVGYNTAKTSADLKGNYPLITGANQYTTSLDPVSISQKDISGLRTNVGFQLKMAFLRIYGSYSIAEYNSINAGIGFGIGN